MLCSFDADYELIRRLSRVLRLLYRTVSQCHHQDLLNNGGECILPQTTSLPALSCPIFEKTARRRRREDNNGLFDCLLWVMLRTKVPFWWCSHKAQQSTKDYSRRSQSHCLLQQRITHEESVVNLLSFQTSTMSTAPGNIFLTTENLAFSLPLIIVCGTYVSQKRVYMMGVTSAVDVTLMFWLDLSISSTVDP